MLVSVPEHFGLLLEDIYICQDTWVGQSKLVYTVSTSCAQFLLPVIIVVVLYLSIFLKLRNRPQVNNGVPPFTRGKFKLFNDASNCYCYYRANMPKTMRNGGEPT